MRLPHAARRQRLRQLPLQNVLEPLRTGSSGSRFSTSPAKAWISRLPRLAPLQAARPQVEQRLVVELADRGAVRALDVVGEDLELRLGVDLRVVREQQRPVGLLGVGLLRVGPDDDLAVEDAARAIVQDALVDLAAAAVRLRVVDRRVVVDEPLRRRPAYSPFSVHSTPSPFERPRPRRCGPARRRG